MNMRRNPCCKYIYMWNKFWKKTILPRMGLEPTSPWLLVGYVTTTLPRQPCWQHSHLTECGRVHGFSGQYYIYICIYIHIHKKKCVYWKKCEMLSFCRLLRVHVCQVSFCGSCRLWAGSQDRERWRAVQGVGLHQQWTTGPWQCDQCSGWLEEEGTERLTVNKSF